MTHIQISLHITQTASFIKQSLLYEQVDELLEKIIDLLYVVIQALTIDRFPRITEQLESRESHPTLVEKAGDDCEQYEDSRFKQNASCPALKFSHEHRPAFLSRWMGWQTASSGQGHSPSSSRAF
jgi:hypothetical protein